ncbi:Ser/Thr protein phosphatase superfamily protein [Exidia glandulosa HHB12029]|uniref:Ser/Thr protein phosphatase superfamily protein n=1 Tax=Exidia glandulosa HHB12029 TaxID=1314781 RepID=A0A165NFP8_EXIGL|nr:Ser/Thr protein phosphatase superfamily protein [Exidia glandulosa HHB12029]
MRVQLLSDIHLEMERGDQDLYHFDFPAEGEALALLGDIGLTHDDRLFDWLRVQLGRFKPVFYVSGNHEPYRSSLSTSRQRLLDFEAECNAEAAGDKRFILLDRTRYDVSPTLSILGCTLWSRIEPEDLDILQWALTDFKRIEGFDPSAFQSCHEKDLAWLEESITKIAADEPERKVVVMTHHAPTLQGTSDPKYIGGPTNSAFATELVGGPCWRNNVKVWMFGHTHWNLDEVRDGVRVVSNQRGYGHGGGGFDPTKVIDLSSV